MKKLLILLNSMQRQEDIEKMRKDIAKQLDEGIVIIDSRAREVMLIEDCCKVEIKAVTEE